MVSRSLTAAAAAAVTIIMATGTASAASTGSAATPAAWGPPVGAVCSNGSGVKACFEKYGDKIWLLDNKTDGNWVGAYWEVGGNGWPSLKDNVCENHHGAAAGWTVCNYNMPEHETIYFRGLVMDGDIPVYNGSSGGVQATSTS